MVTINNIKKMTILQINKTSNTPSEETNPRTINNLIKTNSIIKISNPNSTTNLMIEVKINPTKNLPPKILNKPHRRSHQDQDATIEREIVAMKSLMTKDRI